MKKIFTKKLLDGGIILSGCIHQISSSDVILHVCDDPFIIIMLILQLFLASVVFTSSADIIREHWEMHHTFPFRFRALSRSFYEIVRNAEISQFAETFDHRIMELPTTNLILKFDPKSQILNIYFRGSDILYIPLSKFPRGISFKLVSTSNSILMYVLNGEGVINQKRMIFVGPSHEPPEYELALTEEIRKLRL